MPPLMRDSHPIIVILYQKIFLLLQVKRKPDSNTSKSRGSYYSHASQVKGAAGSQRASTQGPDYLTTLSPLCCDLGQCHEETANSQIPSSVMSGPKFIILTTPLSFTRFQIILLSGPSNMV